MSCLDHLLPFIDNGGRRLYIERRRDSKIAQNTERLRVQERRTLASLCWMRHGKQR
jgi:hypothetical protein